jgi:hypothetical protein
MGDRGALNMAIGSGALAWVELLDRDGTVRQAWPVTHWPLRVGRALDNELALGDPHLAPHHLRIDADDAGLTLAVDDTVNGVQLGSKLLRRGEQARLPLDGEPLEFTAGRVRLRLRLPGQRLAPEVAIAPAASLRRRVLPVFTAGIALLACVLFATYLSNDPDTFARAAGSTVLGAIVGIALWCGVWALLSKLFTRQAHFGWHVRVALFAGLVLMVLDALPPLAAFAFSWPAATDFSFVPEIAVIAAALYYHLLAVEPARHRALRWAALTCGVVGVGLTLWFNLQRSDQFGDELYMNHLFPPALRIAKPVSTDALVGSLQPLKALLDRKAKESGGEESAPAEED